MAGPVEGAVTYPDAAIESAAEAMWDGDHGLYHEPWSEADDDLRDEYRGFAHDAYPVIRAAVLAEVEAHILAEFTGKSPINEEFFGDHLDPDDALTEEHMGQAVAYNIQQFAKTLDATEGS